MLRRKHQKQQELHKEAGVGQDREVNIIDLNTNHLVEEVVERRMLPSRETITRQSM